MITMISTQKFLTKLQWLNDMVTEQYPELMHVGIYKAAKLIAIVHLYRKKGIIPENLFELSMLTRKQLKIMKAGILQ